MVETIKQRHAARPLTLVDEGQPEQRGAAGAYAAFGGAFEGSPDVLAGPLLSIEYDEEADQDIFIYGPATNQGGPYGGPEAAPIEEEGDH